MLGIFVPFSIRCCLPKLNLEKFNTMNTISFMSANCGAKLNYHDEGWGRATAPPSYFDRFTLPTFDAMLGEVAGGLSHRHLDRPSPIWATYPIMLPCQKLLVNTISRLLACGLWHRQNSAVVKSPSSWEQTYWVAAARCLPIASSTRPFSKNTMCAWALKTT